MGEIAGKLHPDAPERDVVFEEKLNLFPAGCFALQLEGAMVGYAISHPWRVAEIPQLDAFLGGLPEAPSCLFLHDIAIVPRGRGHGAAAALLERLGDIARHARLHTLALVSLYGSDALWRRLGFQAADCTAFADRLNTYGNGATYMKKTI